MSGTTLVFNDTPLWLAMPMYGSGTGFPIGIFTDRDEAYRVQAGARSKRVLPLYIDTNHGEVGYLQDTKDDYLER